MKRDVSNIALALNAALVLAISACAEIPQGTSNTSQSASDDDASAPAASSAQQAAKLEASDDDALSDSNTVGFDTAGSLGGGISSPISGPLPEGFNGGISADLGGAVAPTTVTIPGATPTIDPNLLSN